jgi:molecular chaperone DnaJ
VTIPDGVAPGDRSRLQAEGESGPPGAPAGDLNVEGSVRAHAIFQRDGDDLYCEVPIRFAQAALGADVVVPTLQGEALIKVPSETQTGKLFRMRGKGVKSVRSHSHGDLLCRVVVETPVNLTAQQRALLKDFEATFEGEEGARHSPRSSGFLDGVKAFWDRMTS